MLTNDEGIIDLKSMMECNDFLSEKKFPLHQTNVDGNIITLCMKFPIRRYIVNVNMIEIFNGDEYALAVNAFNMWVETVNDLKRVA